MFLVISAAILFRRLHNSEHFSKALPPRKGHHIYRYKIHSNRGGNQQWVEIEVYKDGGRRWCIAYAGEISGGIGRITEGIGKEANWDYLVNDGEKSPILFILPKVAKTPRR